MFNKNWFVVSFLTLALGLLSACQLNPSSAETPLTEVTMMLDWVPNTNHTGLFVAAEKGWYEEAGLKVNIIQPGETYAELAVDSGQADFGVSYQEAVTFARAEGAGLVSVAAVIQHNTSGFAARSDDNIKSPKDFAGKSYGSFSSPIEAPMLDLLMSCDGGSVDDVEFIDVGFADFLSITESNQVDFAWIFYGWTGIEAELQGVALDVVMLNEWQDCVPDYYTPTLITNQQMIDEQPEIVKAFVAATTKGYEFAIENPEEAADILLEAAPETNAELVKASQKWLANEYQSDATQWGEQKIEIWQHYADWLAENDILAESLDMSGAFTNDFLPEQ